MGIPGLWPCLKPIQSNKHLSEFAGQTLAVDAYGWLHRGIHTCATQLATGQRTRKYVDYAMHRVRVLRHHKIQPYIVFDGGPLPAKKATESKREQRRQENLSLGNALAAQGRHSQAREHFLKCVDVTPEMAFQFIKALRAADVPYVVAPYEADAQMAYLERIGLVNGVISEDSDLLVFGCRTVLCKLDIVTNTVTAISRDDFASLHSGDGGLSLLGWSDKEFRTMAIMSGCDYLNNLPGVGLKTANVLLRKYRTVENVVKALRLEGKKQVPEGYLAKFKIAEKTFLHQRVYDPLQGKLVHLTEVSEGDKWDDHTEAYVGGHIDAPLASKVAVGDVDPITLLPMKDINPDFCPRVQKALPLGSKVPCPAQNEEGATRAASSQGILKYFGPRESSHNPTVPKTMVVGKSSGKRTLTAVWERANSTKKQRHGDSDDRFPTDKNQSVVQSRFFGGAQAPLPHSIEDVRLSPIMEPAHIQSEKENVPQCEALIEEPVDFVTQEDGYLSPSPSYSRSVTPDVSSPPSAKITGVHPSRSSHDDSWAEAISSPVSKTSPHRSCKKGGPHAQHEDGVPTPDAALFFGPDLHSSPETSATPSPITPEECDFRKTASKPDCWLDEDEIEVDADDEREELVAKGWWNKWAENRTSAQGKKPSFLKRCDTSVTPNGRFSARSRGSASLRSEPSARRGNDARKNSVLLQSKTTTTLRPRIPRREGDAEGEVVAARQQLALFRYHPVQTPR